jgi:methylmalonyl-CoA mutase N-terminal domain/subunit
MRSSAPPELEARQRERLQAARQARDGAAVRETLDRLAQAAAGTDNLMPCVVEAVKARASLGEISDVLRRLWGEYRTAG